MLGISLDEKVDFCRRTLQEDGVDWRRMPQEMKRK